MYWGIYQFINDRLVHRAETDLAVRQIEKGHSVILHGKAGAGKSGCVEEIIQYLNAQHILYLGIKLDKNVPETSADEYGKKLGLPESPIYCLNTLSAGSPCVLILDQLEKVAVDVFSEEEVSQLVGAEFCKLSSRLKKLLQTPASMFVWSKKSKLLITLIESDREIFLKQCRNILSSNTVRHYFKCTVFEVIGQCEEPDESIFALVEEYSGKVEWKDYIFQTVYYGHPVFVIRLGRASSQSWLENRHLALLRSISIWFLIL